MEFLYYPIGFILLLGIVVTVHELGHFLVARWSGVHVLRFSVGFSRPLLTKRDRRGTEFTLAVVPLGGYVRMLDDRDPDQAEQLEALKRHDPSIMSYMEVSPWWRIAIAIAGPAANFVLAFVVFWGVAIIGTPQPIPLFDAADPQSPLGRAGLDVPVEVLAVDGKQTRQLRDLTLALGDRLGDTGTIRFDVKDLETAHEKALEVPISDWHAGEVEPDFISSLGIKRSLFSVVAVVVEESAAERAGLEVGDFIVAINGEPVRYWTDFDRLIKANPDRVIRLDVARDGRRIVLEATPGSRTNADGVLEGYLGVGAGPRHEVQHGLFSGAYVGFMETKDMTLMTLGFLKKMIFGQVSARNLVGPVGNAQIAGDTARTGWLQFAFIMALMSISVGIMNLLPIPLLDGGHVLFNTVELIMGKPVPERVQVVGVQIGVALVGGLLILATYNDILRIF